MKNYRFNELRTLELKRGEWAFSFLGQHGFVFKLGDTLIGCDMFLSPHEGRLIDAPLTEAEAAQVHAVIGSHDHDDHIDRPLWKSLAARRADLRFILPRAVEQTVREATGIEQSRLMCLNDGECVTVCGVTITAIASAHEFLDRDAQGNYPYLGYVFEANGVLLYHCGDCCLYPELYARLEKYRGKLDAVFLPINGRDAERLKSGCIGNMTYQEAADLAGFLQPKLTVPAHFDMFANNSENPLLCTDYMAVKYPRLKTLVPRL